MRPNPTLGPSRQPRRRDSRKECGHYRNRGRAHTGHTQPVALPTTARSGIGNCHSRSRPRSTVTPPRPAPRHPRRSPGESPTLSPENSDRSACQPVALGQAPCPKSSPSQKAMRLIAKKQTQCKLYFETESRFQRLRIGLCHWPSGVECPFFIRVFSLVNVARLTPANPA